MYSLQKTLIRLENRERQSARIVVDTLDSSKENEEIEMYRERLSSVLKSIPQAVQAKYLEQNTHTIYSSDRFIAATFVRGPSMTLISIVPACKAARSHYGRVRMLSSWVRRPRSRKAFESIVSEIEAYIEERATRRNLQKALF